MGFGLVQRLQFVEAFNLAFAANQVARTAARLGPQLRSMDALEIVHRLELLPWVAPERFFQYRDRVGIPALHLQVVTAAVQAVLHAPAGHSVHLTIVEGAAEAVAVSTSGRVTSITLTRTTFDPGDTSAPASAR